MKYLQGILRSVMISLSISYLSIMLIGINSTGLWSGKELQLQFMLALILGIIIGFLNLLFSIESWSYRRILLIHFSLILLTIFVIGAIGKWYDPTSFSSYIQLTIYFIIIYLIITLYFHFAQKNELRVINKYIMESRVKSNEKRD